MKNKYTLGELADYVNGEVHGDADIVVSALNGIDFAQEGEITFLLDLKKVDQLEQCGATACIIDKNAPRVAVPVIAVERPDIAAARIHTLLLNRPFTASGIHESAVIGNDCTIPREVTIGANVVLGDNVKVGERVAIHAGAVIESGVTIGDDTVIHARVTIAHDCVVGNRVVLYHGCVIGSDGFGFATDMYGNHITKPQVGNVRIDDDVHIGACACVDRAAFGTTWIKSGVRIDNLVMVGHNVEVGENSVLVAQTGIAGSSTLGRSVVLGAKAGVNGHVHLDDGVMVAAMAGVHNSQPKGAQLGGIPAVDVKLWGRTAAVQKRLPDMHRELRALKKEVDRLTSLLSEDTEGE